MIIALRGRFSAPTNSSIVEVGVMFLSFAAGGGKFFGDGGSAIKNGDGKSFRFHVEREILAHYRQADQANIRLHRHDFEELVLGYIILRQCSKRVTQTNGKLRL